MRPTALFPILRERRTADGRHAQRRPAEDARPGSGLALDPKLLLVDEPSEGLMPANVELITQRAR